LFTQDRKRERNRDRKDRKEKDKAKGTSGKEGGGDVKPKGEIKEFSKQSFDKKMKVLLIITLSDFCFKILYFYVSSNES